MSNSSMRVNLLDVDRDLGRYLPPETIPRLRSSLHAHVHDLNAGPWAPPQTSPASTHLGYLVVSGMLVRRVMLNGSRSGELLMPGDLIRPWVEDPISFCETDWRAMEPTRLAVLDRSVALGLCARPELNAALLDKQMQRCRSLAINAATENVRGLDRRLVVLFWHLAERWGRRENGKVIVPIKLTHETLSLLAGARRPSVTTALSDLAASGELKRDENGHWILSGAPPVPASPKPSE